jgi:hypothetical protein
VLYGGDPLEPFATEVPPTMGTVVAFRRAKHSRRGPQPFAGARRVVQVVSVTNGGEVARKKKLNNLAQFFKDLFGR